MVFIRDSFQVHVAKKGRELGLVLFVSTANRLHSGLVMSMLPGCIRELIGVHEVSCHERKSQFYVVLSLARFLGTVMAVYRSRFHGLASAMERALLEQVSMQLRE